MNKIFCILSPLIFLLLAACIPEPKQPPTLTPTLSPPPTVTPLPTDTPEPSPTPATLFQSAGQTTLSGARRLVWSNDSQSLAILAESGAALLSIPDLATLFTLNDPALGSLLDFSPDGRALVSTSDQQTLILTDITNGVQRTLSPGFLIAATHFSPDGTFLLVASNEEWAANLYDAHSLEFRKKVTGFETAAPIYDVRIAENILDLAWSARATIQLQNIPDETLYPALSHEDFVTAFARARGEPLLVSAAGGTINNQFAPILFVWDPTTGEELLRLEQDAMPYSLEFSWDDRLLAVGLADRVDIYTTSDMNRVETLTGHAESVISARFSPDGRWLATLDSTGGLRLWRSTRQP
ncbi:MAG: hypothetical protein ROW48_17275 [Bellilinea sp.]|jgi:WD40 repeat protein